MNFTDFFANRSSVRAFSDKEISAETLEKLISASSHAPNTGNMQLYSVIATLDPEKKKQVAALHFNQPAALGCSILLTFCTDTRRFEKWCEQGKTESSLNNFGGFFMSMMDACLFAQQFVTLAELEGLGTCFLGTVAYDVKGFSKLLGLPQGVVPLVGLAVGYPASPAKPSDRLPIEAILHYETFSDYTPEDIERFYAEKEALPENPKFISENNKETLAQVYAQVRYPKHLNEKIETDYADILGFKTKK